MNRLSKILLCVLTLLPGTGCQMPAHQQEARYVDPVLPMSCGRCELVDHLNRQNQDLDGWQCTSTRMQVRLPNGMTQRLKGAIACQAPQYFRLTASNVIANADLGSNASRCWVYVKPGENAVMTWKHEDTSLLQQMPGGVPYIDPNWLMLVLGVTPLDADDYELRPGPAGTHELWLTATEQRLNGPPQSRRIKVDAVHGVIREHSVYDSEENLLVRAILSQHRHHDGKQIPEVVKLQFPQMNSEMLLTFHNIETNPHLPDELWRLPDHNVKVVDLGQVIRNRMHMLAGQPSPPLSAQKYQPPRARLQPPVFGNSPAKSASLIPSDTVTDGAPALASSTSAAPLVAPKWDSPAEDYDTAARNVSFEQPRPSPSARRSWWSFWKR